MKKVLYVATVDIHIKAFHIPYLKMLKDNGFEVHVATNGDEKFENCDFKHKISIERSPFSFRNLKAIRQLKDIIEKEKFDIIHCHTPMGAVVARLAAKKARKQYNTKVIYTAHGFHFYKGAPLLNWILFYPIEWYLSKYTDTLITINKEDYRLANKKFINRCKSIQYIPGVGINTQKFDTNISEEEKERLRKEIGIKKDDFILTCIGRLDKNKNQGFLIKCISKLIEKNPNIHLLLAGQDELNGEYQALTKKLRIGDHVHFLGNREDIPNLLKITNIIVSSSKREGLPVNILEGLATGLPIVALNCRGMKDLIENSKNGYVIDIDNNTEREYIEKILKIYNLIPKALNEIKNNNLIKAKQYDIESLKKIYSNMYFNKRLVFVHGGAFARKDKDGNIYVGGSYSEEVWKRYYYFANDVTVLFRLDEKYIQGKN